MKLKARLEGQCLHPVFLFDFTMWQMGHKRAPNFMTSHQELAFKVFEAYMLHTEQGG